MTKTVTVYTMPACVQCDRTKKNLDRNGVEYTAVDIAQTQEAYDYVSSIGYKAAPVVVISNGDGDDVHFYGYRPDLIRQHILNEGE